MAETRTGRFWGTWLDLQSGTYGRKWVDVVINSFNQSTGKVTFSYSTAFNVEGGDFQGSTFTNYGGWGDTFQVWTGENNGWHESNNLQVDYNGEVHFYEECGYNSSSMGGYVGSAVDFRWTPETWVRNNYPNWSADGYFVYYNANGGTGAPATQNKAYGATLTISPTIPVRQNYEFKGWSVSPTSKIGVFKSGDSYTYNQNVTLYAVWEYNGPTPTLNASSNRFINLQGLSIFWNKLKSKFGPTILYDRGARTTPTSTTTLSDRDVQLSESCFNYSKLVIEIVFMNNFLITTTIYNPYPNYRFNIIQTQFVDNNHGGQDYATYVGFCRISADGTILRCNYNDGTWCSPTDWTTQWIPDVSSEGVTHAINKVIGYKM